MKPAYYNEFDTHAAAWLRVLIARNLIAPGDVDERSITEVQPDDLRGYTQCHFFAGIGGWSAALRLAGWPDVRPVWTGSCPCQPFSAAGAQRGSDDERHLWPAFFRIIRECRPTSVFGEQVAGAAGLAWLDHVCADLEGAGYAAAAANLCAAGAGAPHIRQRLYWVANGLGADGMDYTIGPRLEGHRSDQAASGRNGAAGSTAEAGAPDAWRDLEWIACSDGKARPTQPGLFPLVDGLSPRVVRGGDRSLAPDADQSAEGRVMWLRGYGNAIVPQVAAEFIRAAT